MVGTRSLLKKLVGSLRIGGEIAGGRDEDADVSFTMPSSNLGIRAPPPAISCILFICGYCLSTNPDFSN